MLEPMRTVETEETPGAGRFVERPVAERNEMPGARAAARGEGGFVEFCVGSGGAVGEQLVVEPGSHVDLADTGLGLRVADVDHAVSEVEVGEVQLAHLAVAKSAAAEGREDCAARTRVPVLAVAPGEPDGGALGHVELSGNLLPGSVVATHLPRQLSARERLLGDRRVDPRRCLDECQQLVRLEEVPLPVRGLQPELAVGCRVAREEPPLHGVGEDTGGEVQRHVDRARTERPAGLTPPVSKRDAGFPRCLDLLVSLQLVRTVRRQHGVVDLVDP